MIESQGQRNGNPKRLKRSKITTTHRVNKTRRLRYGSISIPLNDAHGYHQALKATQIYPFPPSADELMNFAVKNGLLNKVVFGLWANKVIEGILLDEATGIPWQVSKVTVEYKQVDYTSTTQPYSQRSLQGEDNPVCPRSVPSLTEMTTAEEVAALRKEV